MQTMQTRKTVVAPDDRTQKRAAPDDPIEEIAVAATKEKALTRSTSRSGLFKTKNMNRSWKWKEFLGKREKNPNPKKWLCILCYE
jgi:hypothetical protein